ncbi:hypothetical protein N5F23_00225 [Pseudomonas sichuanensis]|uniref:hypothetical protein n=1 Tax=Pseudomonas TaxID=286 RepID=UPI00129B894A|nr:MULTISPECIES: hypothetical protein [Pseudomonas]MDH0731006.1 hypothetical protein [Pseudomonas sichuanensis]MDH1581017.1 hypothetical protein [Pseudomonas sichuanensis]MDH1591122.1 hypothetical protein [Pseudomonas sichuanensis]MDH1596791.1 hypothetical protein [Pseudomonas sichuanensis]MDU9403908.1 hypothetical protein [Pseudomonas sp. zfem004]
MKRINKLIQQRRHQLHVHLPPSGLEAAPFTAAVGACARWLPSLDTEIQLRTPPHTGVMPSRTETLARS